MASRPPPPPQKKPPPPLSRTTADSKKAIGATVDETAVRNDGMQSLIPIVNKLQDALTVMGDEATIDLPQIAVVGGQSSGKSSVLENIVGKSFLPRGTGIVTRRPLILQLFTSKGEEYGQFLHDPGRKYYAFDEICAEIDADTARVCGSNKGLHPQPINLKIYSPNVLPLTLIDLPGATKVAVGDQPEDIGDQIREMLLSFISKPNCLILAVTAANTDLANSDALQLAKMVDPSGNRTLGVLTKLDLMDRGTDARELFTGESTDLPTLKLGYVGVVNRSQADINERKTIAEARAAEMEFFTSSPAYADLAHKLGTAFLVEACSKMLMEHIQNTLPTLAAGIARLIEEKQAELDSYGDSSPEVLRRKLISCLVKVSRRFSGLLSGADLGPLEGAAEEEKDGGVAIGSSTGLLSGGSRIEGILTTVFAQTLGEVDVTGAMDPKDVQAVVRNAKGLGGGLFTPDEAFLKLVKSAISKLRKPSLEVVSSVHTELLTIARTATDLHTLRDYPELKKAVMQVLTGVIQKQHDATADLVKTILAMETNRINIHHPDFLGEGRSVIDVMKETESAIRRREAGVVGGGGAGVGADGPAPPIGRATDSPHSMRVRTIGSSKALSADDADTIRAAMIASAEKNKPVVPPRPKTPPRPPLSRGASDGASSARRVSQVIHEFTVNLTLHEKVEVEAILFLVESYFSIVRKSIGDYVPKAVALKFVEETTTDLEINLLTELDHQETIDRLMSTSPEIQQRIASISETLKLLREANAVLENLRHQGF